MNIFVIPNIFGANSLFINWSSWNKREFNVVWCRLNSNGPRSKSPFIIRKCKKTLVYALEIRHVCEFTKQNTLSEKTKWTVVILFFLKHVSHGHSLFQNSSEKISKIPFQIIDTRYISSYRSLFLAKCIKFCTCGGAFA